MQNYSETAPDSTDLVGIRSSFVSKMHQMPKLKEFYFSTFCILLIISVVC